MNPQSSNHSLLTAAAASLLHWYVGHHRDLPWRTDPSPYHVWISEIMLQQTRVEAVKPYYTRFLQACPTVRDLAQMDDERLLKLWEGLGYYSRARNLKKAAQQIVAQYGGSLPPDHKALLALPGIGPYTAGAIASIAFGIPAPAVDGNVLRVVTRLTGMRDDITKPQTKNAITGMLAKVYPTEPEDVSCLTQALMELGATVCLPVGEPHCDLCPLQELCCAHLAGVTDVIPCRSAKKPRKQEKLTVLLLRHRGTYALRKRKNSGLLAGMWEFPSVSGFLTEEQIKNLFRFPVSPTALGSAKHIFTHVEWDMIGYRVEVDEALPEYIWKTPEQIRKECAIPSAFRAYLTAIAEPT